MTWRWKNIHFAGDDPPAGPTREQLAAHDAAKAAAEKTLGIEKELVKESRARLRIATTLEEKAIAYRDLMAATNRENAAYLEKEKQDLIEMGAYNEEEFQRKKKILAVDKEMYDISVDLGATVKSFASDWAFIDDKSDDFAQSLWRASQHAGGMKVFLRESAGHIVALTSNANILEATWNQIQVGVGFMVAELESSLPAFNKATGAAGKLNAEIITATNEIRQYGVGMGEAAASMNALAATVGNFNRMGATTRNELVVLAAGMEQVGVSSETTANLVNSMTKSLGMSTDAAQASIKSVAATARALEMPVSALVGALDQAMPRLAQFGKEAPEVLKKVAAAAKATGIEIGALMGIVGQYDTWEGAAEAAGRLNAMLGGPLLNSIDLLKASDEERIRMLIGSMEASGKNWESMGRFERQAIASAAGISDLNEAGKLFSTTLSEYDYQQAEAQQAEENAEAYNEMISAAVPLMEKWTQVYMKAWGALGPVIMPVLTLLKSFADFLLEWNPWVLLIGGFALWIATLKTAGYYARQLATSLVTSTVATVQSTIAGQTDNIVKKQGIIMSILSGKMTMKEIILDRLYAVNKLLGANAARLGWMTRKQDIFYSLQSINVRLGEIATDIWANKVKYASAAATWVLTVAKRALTVAMLASPYLLAAAALFLLYKAFGPVGVAIGVLTLAVIAFNMGAISGPFGMIIMGAAAVVAGFMLLKKMGLLPLVGALILVTAAVWSFNTAFWSSGLGAIIGVIGLIVLGFIWLGNKIGFAKASLIALALALPFITIPLMIIIGLFMLIKENWDLIVDSMMTGAKVIFGWLTWPFRMAKKVIKSVLDFLMPGSPSSFMLGIIEGIAGGAKVLIDTFLYPFQKIFDLVTGVLAAFSAFLKTVADSSVVFATAIQQVAQAFVTMAPAIPIVAAGLWLMLPPMAGLAYATVIFAAGLWSAVIPLVIFTASVATLSLFALPMTILANALTMMSAVFVQWPSALAFAGAIGYLAVSFAGLAVSLLMIAAIYPFLPLIVAVFATLAVVFALISLSITLVATQMSNLMESMSELAASGTVVTIGTSIKEVAEGINEASLLKTVALTGFMGATALAGAVGGGGEKDNLAAAVNELRQEVAATNAIYREIASQPIIIKVGDQTIKKYVDRGIGDKIIAAVRANASTAAGR